jgi:hypothetical protein
MTTQPTTPRREQSHSTQSNASEALYSDSLSTEESTSEVASQHLNTEKGPYETLDGVLAYYQRLNKQDGCGSIYWGNQFSSSKLLNDLPRQDQECKGHQKG